MAPTNTEWAGESRRVSQADNSRCLRRPSKSSEEAVGTFVWRTQAASPRKFARPLSLFLWEQMVLVDSARDLVAW